RVLAYVEAATESLLQALETRPVQAALSLPLLPANELRALHRHWVGTRVTGGVPSVHDAFEAQARRTPDNVAVDCGGRQITYAALDRQANRLAHHLQAQGTDDGTLVAMCMERGVEAIVAMLAILKAGGAYLPLDPHYPASRLQYMLADSRASIVLTENALIANCAQIPGIRASFIAIDDASFVAELEHYPDCALSPLPISSTSSLAYVIYTSGSTGQPKGVMIEHGSALNMAAYQQAEFVLTQESRMLGFASLSFDVAAAEWMTALLCGAGLYLCTEEQRKNLRELERYMVAAGVTHAMFPAAVLPHLQRDLPYALQCVVIGGESAGPQAIAHWLERFPLYNAYGPTEATVIASVGKLERGKSVTIGRGMPNVQLYVCDAHRRLVPAGVVGELYIGGVGLAHGYLNRPELTAERFVDNPFHDPLDPASSTHLYRTGDLVSRTMEGEFAYVGRTDSQVKLRGYRIELSEIEHQIALCEFVKAAAVLVSEPAPGNKQLVAYVTRNPSREADSDQLADHIRAWLRDRLPEYMVPSSFVQLDALPLTPNGKIDQKALPVLQATFGQQTYVEPVGEVELRLAIVWAAVLQHADHAVGRNSNFFMLGGHSLSVITLVGAIREEFQVEIGIKDVFQNSSLDAMAALVASLVRQEGEFPPARPPLLRMQRDIAALPLSFAQQRMWMLCQLAGSNAHYNM
ncbi:amino acid adenylation domain-containing protein, partial [Massilia sp.]|uniref:non-ribosomal peptide synthetase n=1 Tax=Massilia sp. TaxID=1882437 RepID=UPI00352D4A0B